MGTRRLVGKTELADIWFWPCGLLPRLQGASCWSAYWSVEASTSCSTAAWHAQIAGASNKVDNECGNQPYTTRSRCTSAEAVAAYDLLNMRLRLHNLNFGAGHGLSYLPNGA